MPNDRIRLIDLLSGGLGVTPGSPHARRRLGSAVVATTPWQLLNLVLRAADAGAHAGTVRAMRFWLLSGFRSFVRRSNDRRLERTVGSRAGLRALFAVVRASLPPERVEGFVGELCCELRAAGGELRIWTVDIGPERTVLRPGRGPDPRLTVKLSVVDFVRIAGGDLDAGQALLTGRLDLEGDFSAATQLGEILGRG